MASRRRLPLPLSLYLVRSGQSKARRRKIKVLTDWQIGRLSTVDEGNVIKGCNIRTCLGLVRVSAAVGGEAH